MIREILGGLKDGCIAVAVAGMFMVWIVVLILDAMARAPI